MSRGFANILAVPGEHVPKDHFVIVDCVGVCERDKTDSRPMDQKKSVPLDALLQAVSLGNVEPEVLSSVAVRLARLDAQLSDAERAKVVTEAGGLGLKELSRGIVQSFEAFIAQHRDEITALQILYNRPTKAPLKFEDLKALADTLQAPPHLWTESQLWQAYAALDQNKVKGATRRRILTDLVSLVRYAMHQENELVPYPEKVMANLKAWLAQQETAPSPASAGEGRGEGRKFTDEQRWWPEKMAEHIASNLGIEAEDFGFAPFDQRGGLGRVHQLFGAELPKVIEGLNAALVA